MFKNVFLYLLIGALLFTSVVPFPTLAQTKPNAETERITKLKTKLAKFGTGKKARLEVRLSDNTKRTGYLSEVKEHSFVLTDLKTGQNTEVVYANVADARKTGMPGWAWGVIIAGGVVGGLFILGHTALPNLGS